MRFYKKVKTLVNTTISATIYDENDQEIAFKWFYGFLDSNAAAEKRYKKAHKWADARIAIAENNEVHIKPYDLTE